MKFKILFVLLTCLFLTQLNASDTKDESSPIRFCLWPGAWTVPADTNINGFSFGLATEAIKDKKMTGCDLALLTSETENFDGFQMGLGAAICTKGEGIAVGLFGTDTEDFNGGSISAIVNNTELSSNFWQIGWYNVARKSNGFQIGILNAMDNGFIPLCPLFNFSVSKSK
ncbi:MAG: hypothetical protein GY756_24445 [bacterium]|nr:hypothetical protein [bacterium]